MALKSKQVAREASHSIAALNRAVAVGVPEKGLAELEKIPDLSKFSDDPFFPAARGECCRLAGHGNEAWGCLERALELARNRDEARFPQTKIAASRCTSRPTDRNLYLRPLPFDADSGMY